MYNHTLVFDDQVFEQGLALPVNTSATAANPMRVGKAAGKLAVSVLAGDGNVALALGKKLTLSILESDAEDGPFTAPAAAPSLEITYAEAFTPDQGDKIASMILPVDAGKWVKAVVATDDAAAAGQIDVILEYTAG